MSVFELRPMELPLEIILKVVESLDNTQALVLDTRTNDIAKSLLSFTTVSRLTYPIALRILYQRCLWIDSDERLRLLLRSLDIHLRTTRSASSMIPYVNIRDCLQNLFLAPYKGSLDDLPVAHWIFELFATMRHTLRRLAIDIPLRSLYPEDDHLNVRPKLRAAFEELTNLEEFTSINDELFLSTHEDRWAPSHESPVWSEWHSLKHLALYNIDIEYEDFELLPTLSQLKTLVLVRPDGTSKDAWLSLLGKFKQKNLTIFEVNKYNHFTSRSCIDSLLRDHEPSKLPVATKSIDVPYTCTCGEHDDGIALVKAWVKERVIDGSMWEQSLLETAIEDAGTRSMKSASVCGCPATWLLGPPEVLDPDTGCAITTVH